MNKLDISSRCSDGKYELDTFFCHLRPFLSKLQNVYSFFLLYFYNTCRCIIASWMTMMFNCNRFPKMDRQNSLTHTKNPHQSLLDSQICPVSRDFHSTTATSRAVCHLTVVFERPLVELAEAASYQSHSGLLRSWADINIWKCPPPPHRWLHWCKGLNGKHQPLQINI